MPQYSELGSIITGHKLGISLALIVNNSFIAIGEIMSNIIKPIVMRATALLIIFLLFTVMAYGQNETGQIVGVVTDPAGAVIVNAKILINSSEIGAERQTLTNDQGAYSVTNLTPGKYS